MTIISSTVKSNFFLVMILILYMKFYFGDPSLKHGRFFCFQPGATIEAELRDKEGKAAPVTASMYSLTEQLYPGQRGVPCNGTHWAKGSWIWDSCERPGHA